MVKIVIILKVNWYRCNRIGSFASDLLGLSSILLKLDKVKTNKLFVIKKCYNFLDIITVVGRPTFAKQLYRHVYVSEVLAIH